MASFQESDSDPSECEIRSSSVGQKETSLTFSRSLLGSVLGSGVFGRAFGRAFSPGAGLNSRWEGRAACRIRPLEKQTLWKALPQRTL